MMVLHCGYDKVAKNVTDPKKKKRVQGEYEYTVIDWSWNDTVWAWYT